MRWLAVTIAAFALVLPPVAATAQPRYQVKVVSQSERAFHPPFADDTFWLGDYLWLYLRDRSLGKGLLRKYRVCWAYQSIQRKGCKSGVASSVWPASPPLIRNTFNSDMTVTWYVSGQVVVTKKLRITGE